MKYTKSLIAAVALFGGASIASAVQIRVESTTGVPGLDSFGQSLSSSAANTFTFSVGTFASGFDPVTADFDSIASSWQDHGYTANWQISGPFANRVRIPFSMQNSELTGQQAYVWGYDEQGTTGQWVIITNDSWIFPTVNATQLPNDIDPANIWNLNGAGNVALVGSFINGNPAEGFQLQAIPEPSTYALIFGLGILGFLGFRRFRK